MSIKKILMLASMALAAIAFAVPASALAAEDGELYDVDTEHTVTAGETLELTGDAEFTALGTGIKCTVHAELEADSASTLTITNFTITYFHTNGDHCEYTGFYAGCTLEEVETNTPIDVTVTTEDFDIENVFIFGTFTPETCEFPFTFSSLEFERVTATPLTEGGEPAGPTDPIHAVELDTTPEGENCNDFGCTEVEAHGILEVVGEDTGTYAFKH